MKKGRTLKKVPKEAGNARLINTNSNVEGIGKVNIVYAGQFEGTNNYQYAQFKGIFNLR